jgi:hypothetical protein
MAGATRPTKTSYEGQCGPEGVDPIPVTVLLTCDHIRDESDPSPQTMKILFPSFILQNSLRYDTKNPVFRETSHFTSISKSVGCDFKPWSRHPLYWKVTLVQLNLHYFAFYQ